MLLSDARLKIIVLVATVTLGFFVGRETANKNADKSMEISQDTQKSTDKHTTGTTTIIKEPDGTVKTVKVIDVVEHTDTDKQETKDVKVSAVGPKTNISALIGGRLSPLDSPYYGISVNREFLGPVTLGAWGLTNGTLGLSIGVNF